MCFKSARTCSIMISLIILRLSLSLGSFEKLVRRLNRDTLESPTCCERSVSRFLAGTQDSILLLVTITSRMLVGNFLINSTFSDITEIVRQGSRALIFNVIYFAQFIDQGLRFFNTFCKIFYSPKPGVLY